MEVDLKIDFNEFKNNIILNSDSEQLSRTFFNLIKNSIESIQEKKTYKSNFMGKIIIELYDNPTDIDFIIKDNGVGFQKFSDNINHILNPYFTTKENGCGLGLSIVNKIINDHNGKINFISLNDGAKIQIKFKKL